jgi:hypothetical protein
MGGLSFVVLVFPLMTQATHAYSGQIFIYQFTHRFGCRVVMFLGHQRSGIFFTEQSMLC